MEQEDVPDDKEEPECQAEMMHVLRRVTRRRVLNVTVCRWQEEVDKQTEKEMSKIPEISRKEFVKPRAQAKSWL